MKIPGEAKIGFIGILVVVVIIWGINFLKGQNIFSSNNIYYARYGHVQGLEPSANIMMQGYKIGTVDRINYNTAQEPPFLVVLEIEKKYALPLGSSAEIISADLLGTKAIRIGRSGAAVYHRAGDTLRSLVVPDMLSGLMEQVSPVVERIEMLAVTLDSLGGHLNRVLSDASVMHTLDHLESVSRNLRLQLDDNGDLKKTLSNLESVTARIRSQNDDIGSTLANLNAVSSKLNNHALDSTLAGLGEFSTSLNRITAQIESGEGSLGQLLYNDSLYDHVSALGASLDSLINDLREHPEKYVQFSVF